MLVILQKESPAPGSNRSDRNHLQRGGGSYCPDTVPGDPASCDPAYAGLVNQAYRMAKQWTQYRVDPAKYNYQADRPSPSRRLPPDSQPRRLTVYRQRILNKQKTALDGDRVPVRAKAAFGRVFGSNTELRSINDQLAANMGDIAELDDGTRLTVQRVDRVIAMAEAHNTADNIVYAPIQVPAGVNSGNVQGWLKNGFAVGTEVNFDRYTISTHEMGQATGHHPQWRPVCEIVTRRGAYVGKAAEDQ